jgi:S-formylglutathione hydrolase FrmB
VLTRRAVLLGTGAGVIGLAAGGLELVSHGVLPGQHVLDQLDGACSAPAPAETFTAAGESVSGSFFSRARGREVGYTIAYPPGHRAGDPLPVALVLHAHGGTHASGYGGLSLATALAATIPGRPRPAIALAAPDGGNLYWNPHPGDDPMAMLVDEFVPLCRSRGLGRAPGSVAATGISMGGYGVLLLAERHPRLLSAVAAISPAVFTSYTQAIGADADAYASPRDFAADDVVAHAGRLAGTPVRIASGDSDPFHPGVEALASRLPVSADVTFTSGCHDGAFFAAQRSESLDFIAGHLGAAGV